MKNKKNINEYEAVYRLTSRNFGFATIFNEEKNENEDIYISTKDSKFALDGDKVLIRIVKSNEGLVGQHREGIVLTIIERKTDIIIGELILNKNIGFVKPINRKIPFDIHIEKKFLGKITNGTIVATKLLPALNILIGKKNISPEGMIKDIIGNKNDPNVELIAIVEDFKIKHNFDEETEKEANKVAAKITEKEIERRNDLRQKCFITIDGEDTKDIDDAICLENALNGNKKLYVSIADVSHYVREGTALDKEALVRGNSVYLLDRVIPMLPKVLSNGICSLNENEDRLTITCEMEFDEDGKMVNHNIYESIIKSKKRMTYNQVQNIFDNNSDENNISQEIIDMIFDMYLLSRKIRKKRNDRGAINFNIKEAYIEVDENLVPIAIKEKTKMESNDLIEDFMVAANETVAEEFYYREVPFLYRTHEACDDEKIKSLIEILANFGVAMPYRKKIHPKEIQQVLKEVEGKEYQYVIENLTLRSMSQAKYTKEALGHFALASKYYTHFTSPIRRYNDLQIHRIIKEVLNGRLDENRIKHYNEILDGVAFNISKTERTAIDCERDVDILKKCQFMEDKVGETYEGTISGLTNFGIFVELENTVEGMVPMRSIEDDYYEFDEKKYQVVGLRNHKIFMLGQKVNIMITRVSTEFRLIDMQFI